MQQSSSVSERVQTKAESRAAQRQPSLLGGANITAPRTTQRPSSAPRVARGTPTASARSARSACSSDLVKWPSGKHLRAQVADGPGLDSLTLRVGPLDKTTPAQGLVLLLHGAGGSAECFQSYAEEWSVSMPNVAFLMPSAPKRGSFTSWFGRTGQQCKVGFGKQPQLIKYARVQSELHDMLEKECCSLGLSLGQVVILGYSAGALMASWLTLQLPESCAGLVCLHGLCPDNRLPNPPPCPKSGRPPALCLAGGSDVQIPPAAVEKSVDLLRNRWNFQDVDYRISPSHGHAVGDDEFEAMKEFMVACLQRELVSSANDACTTTA